MHRSESAAGLRRIEGNEKGNFIVFEETLSKRLSNALRSYAAPLVSRAATSLSPRRCFYAREAFLPFFRPPSLPPLFLSPSFCPPSLPTPLYSTDSLIFSLDFASLSFSLLCERYPEKLNLHFHEDRVESRGKQGGGVRAEEAARQLQRA